MKDTRSVQTTLQEINNFGLYSGLKLNTQKSVLYPISNKHQLKDNNLNLTIKTDTISLLGINLGQDKNINYHHNVSEKCITMQQNLNRWSQRQLSLVGKILVTKSYAISKLIHTMTAMVVHKEDIRSIQQAVNKFIWSNKPAKVKHDVLINPLVEGGLNAIDIECQYKALKLPWVWRLIRSSNWNSVINDTLRQFGGIRLLINCIFDSKTLANVPPFYREVLKFWQEISIPTNCAKFVVWNNKNIKIAKQTIYNEELFSKNVVFVHDFTKNGMFLSHSEFTERYNVTIALTRFNGILRAIKTYVQKYDILDEIQNQPRPNLNLNRTCFQFISGSILDISKAKSKLFYQEFLELKKNYPTALTKWTDNHNIEEDTFYKSLPQTKVSTNESRMLAFQFKIIHNIINNYENLHKWGITETNECQFCNAKTKDDIPHEFLACTWTQNIIMQILNEFNLIEKFQTISNTEFLFGVADKSINNIILVIKYTIHMLRQQSRPFHMLGFKRELYKRIISDKRTLNKKIFDSKWESFPQVVQEAQIFFNSLHV